MSPTRFLLDGLFFLTFLVLRLRPRHLRPGARVTYAANFSAWKQPLLARMFPDRTFLHLPVDAPPGFVTRLDRLVPAGDIVAWGMTVDTEVDACAAARGIAIEHVEDGFVRSVGLGASQVPPLSLCLDRAGIYYNARQPSRLDAILAHHDFDADPDLMAQARACLDLIRAQAISKYNLPDDVASAPGRAPAATRLAERQGDRRTIVCFGQVEDDQSIVYGCDRPLNNNDLIRQAAADHPGARIIYKIHPDYLGGKRRPLSDLAEVAHLCEIVGDEVPLRQLFSSVERVYTITSLAGFEALMRGIPVTTLGMPFYAGWGLTDDRQPAPPWRGRRLTVEQVFAGAYLLYPVYLAPGTLARSDLPSTIGHIVREKERLAALH